MNPGEQLPNDTPAANRAEPTHTNYVDVSSDSESDDEREMNLFRRNDVRALNRAEPTRTDYIDVSSDNDSDYDYRFRLYSDDDEDVEIINQSSSNNGNSAGSDSRPRVVNSVVLERSTNDHQAPTDGISQSSGNAALVTASSSGTPNRASALEPPSSSVAGATLNLRSGEKRVTTSPESSATPKKTKEEVEVDLLALEKKDRDEIIRRHSEVNSPLLCPICFNDYNESSDHDHYPRMLTGCGHTTCQKCLQSWKAERGGRGYTCMLCRKISSAKTLSDLPPNFSLLEMLK